MDYDIHFRGHGARPVSMGERITNEISSMNRFPFTSSRSMSRHCTCQFNLYQRSICEVATGMHVHKGRVTPVSLPPPTKREQTH